MLYIVLFLHQTTTDNNHKMVTTSCILFFSYIKPQPYIFAIYAYKRCILFFSYIKPQHFHFFMFITFSCILFFSYIKPQRTHTQYRSGVCCILFFSYIKPQLLNVENRFFCVVYCSFPTSNHNMTTNYLFEISLYIVLFLHQTTTINVSLLLHRCCILFFSYIKPQHARL